MQAGHMKKVSNKSDGETCATINHFVIYLVKTDSVSHLTSNSIQVSGALGSQSATAEENGERKITKRVKTMEEISLTHIILQASITYIQMVPTNQSHWLTFFFVCFDEWVL